MASKERAFTVTNGVISYGAELSSYGYRYDECNNLTKLTCSVLGSTWSTVYTYDGDNRAATTTLASGKVITNTYDAIGRLTNRALGLNTTYNTALTYVPGNATNKTTGLVATYQNGSDAAYSYTYDDVGNITEITQGTTSIGYVYDDANRLIRENNQVTNQTIVYDYENELWGNIQSRTIYAYTTAENPGTPIAPVVTYTYDTSANGWGDQLVEYNGQTITYDDMGNPTTYRGYTMAWRGKQLVSASNGTNSLTFAYNEDGLRQSKTCNNIMTDYYYNGSVLIGMQRGTSKFLFSYDASGNVVSVNYNGTEYYYLRNAQGDIVKLIDANGTTVVEYIYDTWGKKVTTTGTLAGTLGLFQPFRYRGYVYDWETGFYYLQSRYYDPTTGRFISSDVLLSTGQGVLGHNCYAYCLDNPVALKDEGGSIPSYSVTMSDGGNPKNSRIDTVAAREAWDALVGNYSDPDEAAKAWAKENRNRDSKYEYGAILFKKTIFGKTTYRIGPTLRGSKGNGGNIRPNVIWPIIHDVIFCKYFFEEPYALFHTHPLYEDGTVSHRLSDEDKNLTKGTYLIVLERVYMVPYGGNGIFRFIKGEQMEVDINE